MSLLFAYDSSQGPLSVSQLSASLKLFVEKEFGKVWVEGEISGCKVHSSGHTYFSLKDSGAVMDAICWRGTKLSTPLKDGDLVLCRGKITTYPGRSKYQMIVESAELAGPGLLLRKIEELRMKLAAEGLFDRERKKAIPSFSRKIGILTSPTGAVIQDMLTRFQQRIPCELILYPVSVQGASAVGEIIKGLHYFHAMTSPPDLIIIARGGGSIEDLWAFHDEALVRAVAASTIPIISAVGHETDTTLIDYAADVRAPTPTAAAEMALPLEKDVHAFLERQEKGLQRGLRHVYDLLFLKHQELSHRLKPLHQWVYPLEQRLDDLKDHFIQSSARFFKNKHDRFLLIQEYTRARIKPSLAPWQEKWRALADRLTPLFASHLSRQEALLETYQRLLNQLSYKKTLERGFALAFLGHVEPGDNDFQKLNLCSSAVQAQKAEKMTLCFADGIVQARPLPGQAS